METKIVSQLQLIKYIDDRKLRLEKILEASSIPNVDVRIIRARISELVLLKSKLGGS